MGFLKGGPYYDLIGRTGNNVGRRVKGKNVFSMRPAKSSKRATTAQLNQRIKFGLVTKWMSYALNIVQIGYQHYQSTGSSMNSAVKRALDLSIIGVAPNFALNYPKLELSRGPLVGPYQYAVTSQGSNEIDITWGVGITSGKQSLTDKGVFFVFAPILGQFVELIAPATRGDLSYTAILPIEFSGEQIHVWMFFVNDLGDVVSRSEHRSVTVI